jgi:hypothetical protein
MTPIISSKREENQALRSETKRNFSRNAKHSERYFRLAASATRLFTLPSVRTHLPGMVAPVGNGAQTGAETPSGHSLSNSLVNQNVQEEWRLVQIYLRSRPAKVLLEKH